MGTTKKGRVLNTKGARGVASEYALVHSIEGAYTEATVDHPIRLKSGGHGQKGIDQLDKYGIEYHIVKTYDNGVRVGFIPQHKKKKKQSGIGQAWFPKDWTTKDIKRAGEHVANLKHNKSKSIKDGQPIFGTYKGVRVGVIRTNGIIATIFPDSNQPIRKKDKKK